MNKLVVCMALLLALAGCSSGGRTPLPLAPGSSAAADAAASSAAQTSAEVVARLAAAGLPVTQVVEVTAASDSNQLLGRPGGYTSKTTFSDDTVDVATVLNSTPGSVELGGAVEVYATPAAAQARADYITSITASVPALTEYDYVAGSVVLRLSRALTPDQAQTYKGALDS